MYIEPLQPRFSSHVGKHVSDALDGDAAGVGGDIVVSLLQSPPQSMMWWRCCSSYKSEPPANCRP